MGDLAVAILALARAAEMRRGARVELVEATDIVAKAIRDQLRSGDRVRVEGRLIDAATGRAHTAGGTAAGSAYVPVVIYAADRVRARSGGGSEYDVLLRDDAILGLGDRAARVGYTARSLDQVRLATAEERQAFAAEAELVVRAFNEILKRQAEEYGETVRRAVRLVPR